MSQQYYHDHSHEELREPEGVELATPCVTSSSDVVTAATTTVKIYEAEVAFDEEDTLM